MKVVILAGGFGTRLSEYTNLIPKPMVMVGDRPIIWHVMKIFSNYGFKDFVVALGYKGEEIKKYFMQSLYSGADLQIDLKSGNVRKIRDSAPDWSVTLVDTGLESMTGGRLKRLESYLQDEPFFLTYGDGLSSVNINDLLTFHNSHGKMVTVTAVRPIARFGELVIDNNTVTNFQEKRQTNAGWINGGFFVMRPGFLNFIDDDSSILEKKPLETATKRGELMAYSHEGFWQCMDTKRDKDYLEELWNTGHAPWIL